MDDKVKDYIFRSRNEFILFHLLNDEEIEIVIPHLDLADFSAGSMIFKEGEPGDFIGFIIAGRVEIKKETDFKGKEIVLASLGKGSFVGELAFVDDRQRRSATAIALENVEMIVLHRKALEFIEERYPSVAIKILKGLSHVMAIRLRKTVDRLTSIF